MANYSRVHDMVHLHNRPFYSRDRNMVAVLVKSVAIGSVLLQKFRLIRRALCPLCRKLGHSHSFVMACCEVTKLKENVLQFILLHIEWNRSV